MYKVTIDYDGCTNWEVDLPFAKGTKEVCLDFIAKHLPPKGCEFGIVDTETGRQVSYLVTYAPRRYRLVWQDTKTISN